MVVYFRNLGDGLKEVSVHDGRKLVVLDLDKKMERWFWTWCMENHDKASLVSSMTALRFARKG